VGTRPGQVAEVLAERFEKIVAGDASEHRAVVGRNRLGGRLGNEIEFSIAAAEVLFELAANTGESVDLLAATEVTGTLDAPVAINEFAKLLRSRIRWRCGSEAGRYLPRRARRRVSRFTARLPQKHSTECAPSWGHLWCEVPLTCLAG